MQAYGDVAKESGNRWKLVEASGRNHRKLEFSIESMEVFTNSIEAPTTSMEGSINLHEKKSVFMKKIISRFVTLAKMV